MDAASTQSAAPFPLRMQADTFCDHCGYNLFSQKVWIDERLEIPITRCPECGRFHAAGNADTIWTHRVIAFLTAVRVLGTLAITGMYIFWMVMALLCWLDTQTVQNVYGTRYALELCWPLRPVAPVEWMFLIGMGVCAGWMFGTFFMLVMWHWRRWCLKSLAFVPYVVAAITWAVWFPPDSRDAKALAASMAWFASFEAFGVLLAVYTGRPVVRFVILLVLAPRFRGELMYLWQIDGKTPPDLPKETSCPPSPHSSATPTTSNASSGARSAWGFSSARSCNAIIGPASSSPASPS